MKCCKLVRLRQGRPGMRHYARSHCAVGGGLPTKPEALLLRCMNKVHHIPQLCSLSMPNGHPAVKQCSSAPAIEVKTRQQKFANPKPKEVPQPRCSAVGPPKQVWRQTLDRPASAVEIVALSPTYDDTNMTDRSMVSDSALQYMSRSVPWSDARTTPANCWWVIGPIFSSRRNRAQIFVPN